MRAMVLDRPRQPLQLRDVEKPRPSSGQLLVRIATCAVCRTDLHVVDGELPDPKLPLIPGHQIVGYVEEMEKKAIRSLKLAAVLAFHGLGGPMANAFIVDRNGRICAIERVSPVTLSTAAMPSLPLQMLDSVFICPTATTMLRSRRFFVRD